jgi:hypothetical protein
MPGNSQDLAAFDRKWRRYNRTGLQAQDTFASGIILGECENCNSLDLSRLM